MIFYVDLDYNLISDPTSTGTVYFSTSAPGFLSPDSTQYAPGLDSVSGFASTLSLGIDGRTTGPAPPRDVAIRIYHEVAGKNRVSAIDPATRNLIGQAASLKGVGVGGDGTIYSQGSPYTVASGKVIRHKRFGRAYDEITIRPHADAHRITVPSGRLVGYPNGLRFDGNSAEAEITGYTAVPTEFTLGAAVMLPRVWSVGSSDTMTIAGTRSARLYMTKTTNEYGRQLHFAYEKSGPTTVVIDGPTFDADESVKFLTCRVDTAYTGGIGTGVSVEFGVGQDFETANNGSDTFSATAEAWKLGRFRTSTTDTADTIIGAWFLFDDQLSDTQLISYISQRLTGDEEGLVWYFPGVAVGGDLLDYATTNKEAPLDAAITNATAAPLLLGASELSGAVMPEVIGYQPNAPLTAIDPPRKIYRAGESLGSIGFRALGTALSPEISVYDRGVPYGLDAIYDSILDFSDNPPSASGLVTVSPWMGGLVRIHTEVDGVENTADVTGASSWPTSLTLGSGGRISFGTSLNSVFGGSQWAFELWWAWDDEDSSGNNYVFNSAYMEIRSTFYPNEGGRDVSIQVRINTTAGENSLVLSVDSIRRNATVAMRIEAYNVDGSNCAARLLINGRVVDTASEVSQLAASGLDDAELGPDGGLGRFNLTHTLPMRLWSTVGSSDADAESKQRLYLYENPSPSATGLEGLWYRYTTSVSVLADETANGRDGTLISDGFWCPGIPATDRLSAAKYLLGKSSTSVAFGETAYDHDISTISYHIAGGATTQDPDQPVGISAAQAAASVLSGGGLYLLLNPDNTAIIGQAQDPATATPVASVQVRFVDSLGFADYEALPSVIEALYAPNPTVQTSVLAGADTDRRSFAERPYRSLDEPVGDNRTLYGDDPAPDGRRWLIDTKFADRDPARAEAVRVAAQWDSPRPVRPFHVIGSDPSATDAGFTSYQPGDVLTIRHERLPGGSVNILITDKVPGSTSDRFTGR